MNDPSAGANSHGAIIFSSSQLTVKPCISHNDNHLKGTKTAMP